MERQKYYPIIILLFLVHTLSAMHGNSSKIYAAYVSGKMDQWKNVITEMQYHSPKSYAYLLDEVNYQYGYIGWCIGSKKKEEAKIWIDRMEKNLDFLEQKKFEPSMIAAYKGSLIGFKIGLNKLQAPFIGAKSVGFAKSAIALDPHNPLGPMLYGNILFYTPGLFGGSKEDSMKYYLQALKNMESQPLWIKDNWNYLSLLTVIASAYHEFGQNDKAILYLNKALTTAPGFIWAKKELYPKFHKQQ